MRRTGIFFILIFLSSGISLSQPLTNEEKNSLAGIDHFYLVVNLEKSGETIQSPELDSGAIQDRLFALLTNAGISVLKPEDKKNLPLLYVHVNVLDAGDNLFPFAVQVRFYQALQKSEDRQPIAGSTWEAGNLGIVSMDLFTTIIDSAEDIVRGFLSDYQNVNH